MPIPSYPENRREEYLNNIATGSGEIPPYPENREEQYLDAIAKNGGGGGGSGGGSVVVDITADNTTVTINNVQYNMFYEPVSGDSYQFILVDPAEMSEIESGKLFLSNEEDQDYTRRFVAVVYTFIETTPIVDSYDVKENRIYSPSAIKVVIVETSDGVYALIPNNATYQAGTNDK